MPLGDSPRRRLHREKIAVNSIPDNLCVARPVGKAETERTLAAKVAMQKAWDRLRSKDVWDEADGADNEPDEHALHDRWRERPRKEAVVFTAHPQEAEERVIYAGHSAEDRAVPKELGVVAQRAGDEDERREVGPSKAAVCEAAEVAKPHEIEDNETSAKNGYTVASKTIYMCASKHYF